jgi:uncharacterized protein YrrD
MQFKQNASVITVDGKDVGHIDRVVLDPRTKEVTHVVVRKGFLFTEDKVVPVDLIGAATEDHVTLREDAGDLERLPDFEERHFVMPGRDEWAQDPERMHYAQPMYWYPPTIPLAPYLAQPVPVYKVETDENIPPGTVALKEGAKVVSADDKHVGNVERILTDPQADWVTHFVISQGLLLKEKKLVPTSWVSLIEEDEVHLAVGSETLDKLSPYKD